MEFDPIEEYPIKKFNTIEFGDFKLPVISAEDLRNRYKSAIEDDRVDEYDEGKVEAYSRKFKLLNDFLDVK